MASECTIKELQRYSNVTPVPRSLIPTNAPFLQSLSDDILQQWVKCRASASNLGMVMYGVGWIGAQ